MENLRYNPPSRLDQAPYGFVVKVMGEHEDYSQWIQLGKDPEHPEWYTMGQFLERVFKPSLQDEEFVAALLQDLENIY